MSLTRDSCLLYFDAGYGGRATVGGELKWDRDSGAYFRDALHQIRGPLPIDTPVFEPVLVGTEYRRAMRVEPAATNLVTRSQAFDLWTKSGTPVLTSGQTDPRNGTSAYLVTDDDAAASARILLAVTFTGDGTKAAFVDVAPGTATACAAGIYDATAATYRHLVRITWNGANAPTLASVLGAGTIYDPIRLANGYWRIRFSASGVVAANVNQISFQPTDTASAATGSTYIAHAQVENTPHCTSDIDTDGTTASRASDVPSFLAPPAPQAMAGFTEFVAGMDANGGITDARVWQIGAAANTNPRLFLRHDAAAMTLRIYDATGANVVASPAAAPTTGQRVRVGWAIRADASLYAVVQLDDDAPVAGGPSAALASGIPTAWSSPARLSLSGVGTLVRGRHYHLRHHIVTLADMTNQPGVATAADFLAELEDYYLDPAGNLI